MKHLLIIPLALVLALPAFAQVTNTGTEVVPTIAMPSIPTEAPTKPPTTPAFPPNAPKPDTAPSGMPGKPEADRPSVNQVPPQPQKEIPRNTMPPVLTGTTSAGTERKELYQENMGERKEFRQEIASTTKAILEERNDMPMRGGMPPMTGSTTNGMLMERKELFLENQGERVEFRREIASTTKQAILERREGFASTTKALVTERRALFASSTAAKIIEVREKKEERMEHFASTSALRKAEFTEEMKARILAQAEHAAELLEAMLGRLGGIAERIAERIDILAGNGVETALAEAELAEAYDAINDAEYAVEAVKTAIGTALESETPREMMAQAKTAGDAAKAALRAAHLALQEAAQALPKPTAATTTNAE